MSTIETPVQSADVTSLVAGVSTYTADGPLRAPLEAEGNEPDRTAWVYVDADTPTVSALEIGTIAEVKDGGRVMAGTLYEASVGESGPVVRVGSCFGMHHSGSPDDPRVFDTLHAAAREDLSDSQESFGRLAALVRRVVTFNAGDAARQ